MGRFYIRQTITLNDGKASYVAQCINIDKIHFIDMDSGLLNGKMMIQVHIQTAAGNRTLLMNPEELERFNIECLDNNDDINEMIKDLRDIDVGR